MRAAKHPYAADAAASLGVAILPRDVLVSVEQTMPGGLDPQDWGLLLQVLDLIKANVPADANASPGEVFAIIESTLRERYAKPIEAASVASARG